MSIGEFGIVYKGYIKKSDSNSIEEYLAIKTLKGMLTGKDIIIFYAAVNYLLSCRVL